MLSEHFSVEELTLTTHRAYIAQNRILAAEERAALVALCTTVLEPIRLHFGAPVVIHSGYRCPALNAAIGGAKSSQHMRGEAADFHVIGHDLAEVWQWIWESSGIPYGQVLLEGHAGGAPSWVHCSLGEPWRPRERSRQHAQIRDA